jgi:hypothetical protein
VDNRYPFITCAFLSLLISACGDSGVIYNRDPFARKEYNLGVSNPEDIIRSSQQFAFDHRLEIAINRFSDDRFIVLMHNERLNIRAMKTSLSATIVLDAMTRGAVTDDDRILFSQYVHAVAPTLQNNNRR